MRALLPALVAFGMVAGAVPAAAAPKKGAAKAAPKSAPAAPGAADTTKSEHAVLYLTVLISALQSEQIKDEAKTALVGCLYDNPLSKITDSMDKVFAENADKVHREKPSEVLAVLTAVCGYKGDPTQPAPAAAPAGR